MNIEITLYCPNCQSSKIKRNGKKSSQKQNYFCKDCGRQFIGNHALSYKGCHSELTQRILKMLVRGIEIRDVSEIENISIKKVLSVLVKSNHQIPPGQSHYDTSVSATQLFARLKKTPWLSVLRMLCQSENDVFIRHESANRDVKKQFRTFALFYC